MEPPNPFKKKYHKGYSICFGCSRWVTSINIFFHEGAQWNLCSEDYADYWLNTDKLADDYRSYEK